MDQLQGVKNVFTEKPSRLVATFVCMHECAFVPLCVCVCVCVCVFVCVSACVRACMRHVHI